MPRPVKAVSPPACELALSVKLMPVVADRFVSPDRQLVVGLDMRGMAYNCRAVPQNGDPSGLTPRTGGVRHIAQRGPGLG